MRVIRTQPLTAEAFAPFGDVIGLRAMADRWLNQGLCARHHDLARLEFTDGRAGLSLFLAQRRCLPYTLGMVERHPHGSQAFIPMAMEPFLVIVAPDQGDVPGRPLAFLAPPGQGVNFHRGTWHGVLTPLEGEQKAAALFAVVDRIGEGANLEEHWFDTPWQVVQG